jgi:hypothetical protein
LCKILPIILRRARTCVKKRGGRKRVNKRGRNKKEREDEIEKKKRKRESEREREREERKGRVEIKPKETFFFKIKKAKKCPNGQIISFLENCQMATLRKGERER